MGKIRDPIHGFIHFSNEERGIINSPFFQRLRHIKQLSLTSYVYPGAVHTRFEHSLGVMEVASRMFENLCSKPECRERIETSLKGINVNIDTASQILRLSALLHDIGHLPFSHGAESVLPMGIKHEYVSVKVIHSQEEELKKFYSTEILDAVCQIINNEPIIPELKLLRNIISGSIDADRTDYLIRDSHHCGVDYGFFDSKRLIESLTVVEGSTDGLELSIDAEGVHALEALIMARYYMFTQVYYHKTRRIYDYYLRCFMSKWKDAFEKDILNVLVEDDISVWQSLRTEAADTASEYGVLARRILRRKNHSVIFGSSDFADQANIRKIQKVQKKMAGEYPDYDFFMDKDSGKIHDFFSKGDQEGEELRITKDAQVFLLTEYSKIVESVPKKFYICRLYAAQKNDETKIGQAQLGVLKSRALEIERSVN